MRLYRVSQFFMGPHNKDESMLGFGKVPHDVDRPCQNQHFEQMHKRRRQHAGVYTGLRKVVSMVPSPKQKLNRTHFLKHKMYTYPYNPFKVSVVLGHAKPYIPYI